jgi:hypothetical protein
VNAVALAVEFVHEIALDIFCVLDTNAVVDA